MHPCYISGRVQRILQSRGSGSNAQTADAPLSPRARFGGEAFKDLESPGLPLFSPVCGDSNEEDAAGFFCGDEEDAEEEDEEEDTAAAADDDDSVVFAVLACTSIRWMSGFTSKYEPGS